MRTCALCGAESNGLLCYGHWVKLTITQKLRCGKPFTRAEKKAFLAEIKTQLGLP